MKSKFLIALMLCFAIGLLAGWFLSGLSGAKPKEKADAYAEHESGQVWTCSMHPQIRQQEPGKCPLCGMDLIPLEAAAQTDVDPLAVRMTPEAMQLAQVATAVVQRGSLQKKIRLNGKVLADERRIYSQVAHITGRVEQLLVNFTGESVTKGQVIALIYSPELITAQEELFEAYRMRIEQPRLFEAAVDKLKNWKLTDKQTEQLIASGKPQEVFPVLSDAGGYVLSKKVNTGDYVMRGMPLFEIVDLSAVWVLFDVYESDLPWVKTGDEVVFTVASLPGQEFKGKITFIDPVIDAQTRVSRARVEVQNARHQLKPEMFATGIIEGHIGISGQLVVPKSAVLWSGERSVVYVKQSTPEGISFRMRQVVTGAVMGDQVIIQSGLKAGEEIAVQGTFSIDAAAQLAGKPSMMNPEGGLEQHSHHHTEAPAVSQAELGKQAKNALKPLFENYFKIKDALASDNPEEARHSSEAMLKALRSISEAQFSGTAHQVWEQHSRLLNKALSTMPQQQDVEKFRAAFQQVSDAMIVVAKTFRPLNQALYVDYCPMAANNRGAYWLSNFEEIRNPYFGSAMLSCGEVTDVINK